MRSLWSPDAKVRLKVLGPELSTHWESDGSGFQREGRGCGGGALGLACLLEKWLEETESSSRARKDLAELRAAKPLGMVSWLILN